MLEPRIYQYDPAADTWCTPWAGLARWFDRAIAAVDDRVYFLGGSYWEATECCDGPHPDSAVDRFHPRTGTWDVQPPMPTARDGHAVAVVGRDIYVIGGSRSGHHSGAAAANERLRPE